VVRKPKPSAEEIERSLRLIDEGQSLQYVADLLNVGRVGEGGAGSALKEESGRDV
jgi:hypothetical protein